MSLSLQLLVRNGYNSAGLIQNIIGKHYMTMTVDCPTCGIAVKWIPQNQFRPFCSDRCRLIDLGEWFSEERKIAGDEQTPSSEQPLINLSAEDLALLEED